MASRTSQNRLLRSGTVMGAHEACPPIDGSGQRVAAPYRSQSIATVRNKNCQCRVFRALGSCIA